MVNLYWIDASDWCHKVCYGVLIPWVPCNGPFCGAYKGERLTVWTSQRPWQVSRVISISGRLYGSSLTANSCPIL